MALRTETLLHASCDAWTACVRTVRAPDPNIFRPVRSTLHWIEAPMIKFRGGAHQTSLNRQFRDIGLINVTSASDAPLSGGRYCTLVKRVAIAIS